MPPVSPKPTTYKGVRFKSRLEARWAIFLDHCPDVYSWKYEPQTFYNRATGWTYTPDFLVELMLNGKRYLYILEIKPNRTSVEYLNFLKYFTNLIPYPFFVVSGNFYDIKSQIDAGFNSPGTIPRLFGLGTKAAEHIAANYRFDLSEESNAFPQTRVPGPVRQDSRRRGRSFRQSGKGSREGVRPLRKKRSRRKRN